MTQDGHDSSGSVPVGAASTSHRDDPSGSRRQTGIFHGCPEAGAVPVIERYRSCCSRSIAFPDAHCVSIDTSGAPGWSTNDGITASTGFPVARAMVVQKSFALAFPY
jgi:hypothetical protein